MKIFIKHIILFLSIFILLIIVIDFYSSFIINKYSNFKLTSNPKYIVIGHSHPECAFNDSLISDFKNLSSSGESYFYTYSKVKKIIEQNKSIETIFIEFTNNQIDNGKDDWIWGDEYISHNYPYLSSFMSFPDQYLLFKKNPSGFLNSFSYSNKLKITRLLICNYNFTKNIGGYNYLDRNHTDSLINISCNFNFKNYANKNTKKGISESNLLYLEKIIQFCISHNKKVILVRSPQHSKNPDYVNESKYKEILNYRFKNIDYLDFSNFPLSNSEFADLEHLNYKGAKKISEWFEELIKDGLLLKEDKQKYIKEKIKSKSPIQANE